MTKLRPPLSIEDALTRVAGVLRWERVAEIAELAERTLRRWGDPDEPPGAADAISLGLARKLDAAYRAAGGEGSPLVDCLALQIDLDLTERGANLELARHAGAIAREAGEAVQASIEAASAEACFRTRANARRQLQECHSAIAAALAALRTDDDGGEAFQPGSSK